VGGSKEVEEVKEEVVEVEDKRNNQKQKKHPSRAKWQV